MTQPSSQARSTISYSIRSIVTGSSLIPSTQAASHGRRAQPPGKFGEVVGGVQALHGVGPVVAVDEVVPLGDEVAQRAAVVAERDAAVHAARALLLGRLLVEGLVDLAPVAQADRDRAAPG